MTVIVDNKRYSDAEFSSLPDMPNAKTVYARGCTGLTSLPDMPNAEYVDASGCTGLTSLPDMPNAKTVYASGCTGLTSLPDMPNAEYVYASGCTGLTSLPDMPNAEYVDASGCTGLTSLPDMPNAEYVDASGCTGLTSLPDMPNAKTVYASGCTGLDKLCGHDLPDPVTARERLKVVAEVALATPDALDMSSFHICDTVHCIAGWAITIAGPEGRELERKFGSDVAGTILLGGEASSMFYLSDEDARERLRAVLADSV